MFESCFLYAYPQFNDILPKYQQIVEIKPKQAKKTVNASSLIEGSFHEMHDM